MPQREPLRGGRILMTADAVGGVWQFALDLAGGLAARDVEVVLAVMGPAPSREQRAKAARIPGLILAQRDFRLEWMHGAADDLARAGDWLLALAAKHRPQLVHLNGYAHASLSWQIPTLVTAHSSVCTWWRAVHGTAPPAEWDAYRWSVTRALESADVVVAPTQAFFAALTALYGRIPNGRIIVNGRAAQGFAPAQKEPVVLTAGRMWDSAKNLAALAAVASELPGPLLIAGEPPARQPAGSNMTYLGKLGEADMQRAYAGAAVFALPARYEPFGLAVLEAALSGCALVLGDIPTLRELWGGAASFVDPDDLGALRETVAMLLREPETAGAQGRLARRRACEYQLERMVDGYADAYAELIEAAAGVQPPLSRQPDPDYRESVAS